MATPTTPISVGPWIVRGAWRLCGDCEARVTLTTVAGDERTILATCPDCGRTDTHWCDERMETHACNVCNAPFTTKVCHGMAGSPHWRNMVPQTPAREVTCEPCRLARRAARYRRAAAKLDAQAAKLRANRTNPTNQETP